MLGQEWRIVVWNNTGVALAATDTIEVSGQTWVVGSSGLTYGASTVLVPATDGNSLANGAYIAGTAQTGNTSFGFKGIATATVSTATPAGPIVFFYQEYDATQGWPGNGSGEVLGSINCTATGTQVPLQIDV